MKIKNFKHTWKDGHPYSCVPSIDEANSYYSKNKDEKLPDIHIDKEAHRKILEDYAQTYDSIKFSDNKNKEQSYYYENDMFSYSDAIFLSSFIRNKKPKNILEVGSGFSTAAMVDTVKSISNYSPKIKVIDIDHSRTNALVSADDVEIIQQRFQDTSISDINFLNNGDLLFIDSSHVLKCGSDLHHLFFEIIPNLKQDLYIHFHDIFHPFYYTESQTENGHFWNEAYALRLFLSNNSKWKIHFWIHYAMKEFPDLIGLKLPLCRKRGGGGIYIKNF